MKSAGFLLFTTMAGLCFCSCKKVTVSRPAQQESSAEAGRDKREEIAGLERGIETSKQIIQDLEAAVLMERAKLADDPDYDQGFLIETLNEQQQEREKIENAQKRIGELGK